MTVSPDGESAHVQSAEKHDVPQEDARLEALAGDISALANVQRLKLLHLLTRPHYAEEIAEALGMSRQSALKHIEKLQERGFVRAMHGRRATGPVIEYLVVPQRLFALGVTVGDLGKLEPRGGPALRIAERTAAMVSDPEATQAEDAPTERAAAGHLLVLSGPTTGARFALSGKAGVPARWTIGRAEDRDLRLTHDPFISGHHAEVQGEGDGYVIVDVYSANGTFLNFARLPRGGRLPLRVGDVICVGHTFLVYQADAADALQQ